MTTLSLTRLDDLKADAVVIATAPAGGRKKGVTLVAPPAGLRAASRTKVEAALAELGATGRAGDVVRIPGSVAGMTSGILLAVGLGTDTLTGTAGADALRDAAGVAVRALAGSKRVVLALPVADATALTATAEGALLGAYQFSEFKSTPPAKGEVKTVAIAVADPRDADLRDALHLAQVYAEATSFARDVINTPPSHMHPADLAEAGKEFVADLPITVEILDESALVEGGYGGIVGVGQGAADGPRLVRMSYRPKNAKVHIALIGKGITFDTGGYWLKPTTAMLGMQADMSGAAAVMSAIAGIAELELPVAVTAYAACAENMVSGTAQRPTDVITIYGGKTVEVVNTDAEGRLVMADALARAAEDKPDYVIDVATLTGAMVMSLGHRVAGVFANDDALAKAVVDAGAAVGEPYWQMPILEHMRGHLDSNIADLQNVNVGDRMGGAIVAALFLREFVPANTKWAHLDIAGPALNEGAPYGYVGKGAAGFAVRTLVRLAQDAAEGRLS